MADKKISALTGATTPLAGTEVLPIVQSGATVKVAVSDLTAGRAVTALTYNGNTITTGTGVLTLAAGKTLTASNTLTLAGTDATTQTFPTTSATIARTDAAQTFTGDQTLSANLVQGTAAKGFNFTANTPAAGMTSQLFKWYEEGTWTPSIGGTATYTAQTGTYTRIGRQVTVQGYINVNAIGTGSTGSISGLPFTVGSQNGGGSIGYFSSPAAVSTWQTVAPDSGANTMSVFWLAIASTAPNNATGWFTSGTVTYFSATYFI